METIDKEDRHVAYLRAIELLKSGRSLMIFPEGARNGTENLPVMPLFLGTAKMAMECNVKIVPVGIEQYDKRFVIKFGPELCPENYYDYMELTYDLRNALATQKWKIWENEGVFSRSSLHENYREIFQKEFEKQISPWDTLDTIERTRYHTKEEIEQRLFLDHLDNLILCRENAFLFRKSI